LFPCGLVTLFLTLRVILSAFLLGEKRHLHLDELISLKNAAEAIQTFIRRVTVSFGGPYKTACLLSQDDVGLSLVNVFSHFL